MRSTDGQQNDDTITDDLQFVSAMTFFQPDK